MRLSGSIEVRREESANGPLEEEEELEKNEKEQSTLGTCLECTASPKCTTVCTIVHEDLLR